VADAILTGGLQGYGVLMGESESGPLMERLIENFLKSNLKHGR
jgi:hypothetical protein